MVKKKRLKLNSKNSHPRIEEKINDTLDASVREGAVASVSNGFGISYLSAFALALNATASQVGVLHAISNLLPSIVQLQGARLLEKFTRKNITLFGVFMQAILWLPIIIVGALHLMGYPYMIWVLILFAALFYSSNAMSMLAFSSWIGSLVPDKARGKYFSKRNRAIGFWSIIALISASLILDYSIKLGEISGDLLFYSIVGFLLLFTFAMITKFAAGILLAKQYEPRIKIRKKDESPFLDFLKNSPKNDFGRFTLFRFFLSFAVGISAPFWAVYMLRDLGFSYIWFTLVTVSHMLFQIAFLPVLGRFSDKFGNVRLMKIVIWLIATVPLLWLFSIFITDSLLLRLYIVIIPHMISGISWGGYELAARNYFYDSIGQRKRGFEFSHMHFMIGFGQFTGAAVGSLITLLPFYEVNLILLIMFISFILRLIIAIFGLKYLKEVRSVPEFHYEYMFHELNPLDSGVRDVKPHEHPHNTR